MVSKTGIAKQGGLIMDRLGTTPETNRGSRTNNPILPKLPAYGKALADRQRFNNPPFLVIVCVCANCWNDAKQWNLQPDHSALVLTPEQRPSALQWHVNNCLCLIEWGHGPSEQLIIELVQCLLRSGAVSVTVKPLWIDYSIPAVCFDTKEQQWLALRETIRTYHPKAVQT